jgi:prephenate dehydratase
MKGINDLKHRKLLALSLKIQGEIKHDIDAAVLFALGKELNELNELYSQYLEVLQQLEVLVKEYEVKERNIRSGILSRSLRKLVREGQTGVVLRTVINSLNSCAR